MKTKMSVAMILLLSTGAGAQMAGGAPSQITGTPPMQVSNQIFDESARSYYEPHAPGTVDTIGGGWSAEKKTKFARWHAEKLARQAAKAAANPL